MDQEKWKQCEILGHEIFFSADNRTSLHISKPFVEEFAKFDMFFVKPRNFVSVSPIKFPLYDWQKIETYVGMSEKEQL